MLIEQKNIRNTFIELCRVFSNSDNYYVQDTHSKQRRQLPFVLLKINNPLETQEIEGIESKQIPVIAYHDTCIEYYTELLNPNR